MNKKKLYELLKKYIEPANYESYTDSYGNRIETFLHIDDCAICFLFNPDDDLLYVWHV